MSTPTENQQSQSVEGTSAPVPPNPLAGTPISDWVRDGAAFLLLLISLTLPWGLAVSARAEQVAASRIDIVLVTVLAILSLAVTYLARFGVFGPQITLTRVLLIRIAMNLPYLVLVIVYAVLDVADGGAGPGAAVVFGITGALLAAQPREFEVGTQKPDSSVARLWFGFLTTTAVIFVLAQLAGLIGLVIVVVTFGSFFNVGVLWIVVLLTLIPISAVALLFFFVVRRSEVARTVGIGVGTATLVATLVAQIARFDFLPDLNINGIGSPNYLLFWGGMMAGLLSSPGVRLAMRQLPALDRWLAVVSRGMFVLAAAVAVIALHVILGFFLIGATNTALFVGQLLSLVAVGVGAMIARARLTQRPLDARQFVLVVLCGTAFVGVVVLVLVLVPPTFVTPTVVLAICILLPLWLAGALLVPEPVRAAAAAHTPSASYPTRARVYPGAYPTAYAAMGSESAPTPTPVPVKTAPTRIVPPPSTRIAPPPPVSETPPPPPPAISEELRRAQDPSTTPEELYTLAQQDPSLWPAIAENPSAYPGLLEWLASTGNPDVEAALARRAAKG